MRELLPHLLEVMELVERSHEVILVDDASSDASAEVIRSFQEDNPTIGLISLPERGGQTECFREAFGQVRGEHVIRMDADLQDDPSDLARFLEKIDEGADLVMGLRECRKHPRMLRFASGVYDLLVLLLFDSPLHSNSGSYVAFRTSFIREIPFRKNDHRYIPLIVMRRGAKNIGEVFVRHHERRFGETHYKPLKKLLLGLPEMFLFLIRLYRGVYDLSPAGKPKTVAEKHG